jgi:hypothetical protein
MAYFILKAAKLNNFPAKNFARPRRTELEER